MLFLGPTAHGSIYSKEGLKERRSTSFQVTTFILGHLVELAVVYMAIFKQFSLSLSVSLLPTYGLIHSQFLLAASFFFPLLHKSFQHLVLGELLFCVGISIVAISPTSAMYRKTKGHISVGKPNQNGLGHFGDGEPNSKPS